MATSLPWLYIIFVIISTVVMILLFPRFSSWDRLAKLYGTYQSAPPNVSHMETGSVGLLRFKSTLSVGITPEGLYLNVFPLFRLFHPPLLIPWSAIAKIEPANSLFVNHYRLYINSPKVKLILRQSVLQPARKFLSSENFDWS